MVAILITIWIQGLFSGFVTIGRYGKWLTDINLLLILICQMAALVKCAMADVCTVPVKVNGKHFQYLVPSIGPGADPSVQAVSPQVTVSYPSGGRLPLLSAKPAVTFPAAEHHYPLPSK